MCEREKVLERERVSVCEREREIKGLTLYFFKEQVYDLVLTFKLVNYYKIDKIVFFIVFNIHAILTT